MHRTVFQVTQKLHRSAQRLDFRRLNWRIETNHRIRREFENFVRLAREAGFQFELRVEQHDTPNEGVIQISVAQMPTGAVDRRFSPELGNEKYTDTPVLETRGELVASQSASGYVHFIVHPRQ